MIALPPQIVRENGLSLSLSRLEPHQFERLTALYQGYNSEPPDPQEQIVFVLEVDGEIVASFDLARVMCFGLLHVRPELRQSGVGAILADYVKSHFEAGDSAFIITENEIARRMAQGFGARQLEGTLHRIDF